MANAIASFASAGNPWASVLRTGSVSGSRVRNALLTARQFPSLYAGDVIIRDDGTFLRPQALFRVDDDRLTFEGYIGVDGRPLGSPQGSEAAPLRLGLRLSPSRPGWP